MMRVFSISLFAAFFFLLLNQSQVNPWVSIPVGNITSITGILLFLAVGSVLLEAFFAKPSSSGR